MIVLTLCLLILVAGVFGAIDAAVRPWSHWQRIGGNKAGWIVMQLLVLIPVANLAGAAATILYFTNVRPKLKGAAGELPSL